MASTEPTVPAQTVGARIHRRETIWQIAIPFVLFGIFILALMLGIGLQSDPIWRVRIQAMYELFNFIFCLIPAVFCLYPIYIIVMMSVYGMYRLHQSTERPLRKLELAAIALSERIEWFNQFARTHTENLSTFFSPFMTWMSQFDEPAATEEGKPNDKL